MPTIMTHTAVPLALCQASERSRTWPRLLAPGSVAAMLPDADALAFARHHSNADAAQAVVFECVCTASHRLLDAMTSGNPTTPLSEPRWVQSPLTVAVRWGTCIERMASQNGVS